MGIANSISRLTDYHRRHGFDATIRRVGLAAKRALFANRMVVLYCDLGDQTSRPVVIPSSLKIERVRTEPELSPQDLLEITGFWNPKQARRNIQERFGKGASLWLIKSGDRPAGYGWTLQGCTIAPYYFPMGPKDVQLFDFYVFPKYRGRAMHWLLTAHILQTLAVEGGARAFADTAEWNQAQLSSFRMTPFRRIGMARSFEIFGYRFVNWVDREIAARAQEVTDNRDKAVLMAKSHE
jgi:hypothetical protein